MTKWYRNSNIPCHSSGSKWIVVLWTVTRQATCTIIEIVSKMITKHSKLSISCNLRHAKAPLKPAITTMKTCLLVGLPMLQVLLQRITIFTSQQILTWIKVFNKKGSVLKLCKFPTLWLHKINATVLLQSSKWPTSSTKTRSKWCRWTTLSSKQVQLLLWMVKICSPF